MKSILLLVLSVALFSTASMAQNLTDLKTPEQIEQYKMMVLKNRLSMERNFSSYDFVTSDHSNSKNIKPAQTTNFDSDYCIPISSCSFGDGFDSFTISSIQNTGSGCSENGYGDFTNLATELQAGETYSVSWSTNYGANMASLWIDLNMNFVFDEEERLVTDFELAIPGQIYTTEITIPVDAPQGATVLRIRANWIQSSSDPCEDYGFGETEDYSVYILNTPLNVNVGVKNIIFPDVIEAGPITPQAVIKNYGTDPQSFPVSITIGNYSATAQVENLQPNEETTVDFESWNAEAGSFVVTACTELEGDELTQNDCKSISISVVNSISAFGFIYYDPSGQFNNSWVAFDLASPTEFFKIGSFQSWPPIIGAVYAGEMIFGVGYDGQVYSFDIESGQTTLLYEGTTFIGIAWDGENFYCNSVSELYLFDVSTGEATEIGHFENPDLNGITSIAFDGEGNLYGVDLTDDVLYAIDKETAVTTTIGSLGTSFITILDISFDKVSDVLYIPAIENNTGASGLYAIDINTGEATLVQSFDNNLHFTALAIASQGTLIFPPKNLQASADLNNVSLTWDEPLSGNFLEFKVYRNGEFIASTGQTSYVDQGLNIGIYSYEVTAVYESGESEPAGPVEVAVGNPEISVNPGSISEVLEMGEAVVKQITLFNTGNLDLDYKISPFFSADTSARQQVPEVIPVEFSKAAVERFGEDWAELLNNEPVFLSPQGEDSYCIPAPNCSFGDGITDFKLAEINNFDSGCSPDGYGDFTDQVATLNTGVPYEISFATGYPNNWINVWVDLNQNEIFEENELLVAAFKLAEAGQIYTTQITIPEGTTEGETRLRVSGTWLSPAFDPCDISIFGEAEDYTVSIGELVSWILPNPVSGTIAPGDSAVIEVTLDASELGPMDYNGYIEISSNDSSNLVETIPVNLAVIEQGISNFFPVWETPFNPMSIFVVGAQLDSLDLDLGDEIGIFDIDAISGQEICVGAGLVINPVNSQNFLEIIVSMNDGSNPDEANGFTPGNAIIYKMWNSLTGEVDDVAATYPNPGFNETFTPLGTAIVELSGSAMVGQPLTLSVGWNLISSRAKPHNTNMMTIFQPMMDMGVLEKVIDENGGTMVYLPYPDPEGRWNNSIGSMEMSEGYYVKVNDNLSTTMFGLPMELPQEMPLEAGWNIMGYPAANPQNALDLVLPLIDGNNLYKVIDQEGGVIQYLPFPEPAGTWINTIGNMENGKGYYIKVYDETSLIIDESPAGKSGNTFKRGAAVTEYFEPVYQNNPFMPMHIILFANNNLEAGDEVGIFDGEICVGASVYEGNSENMSITVTAMDDPDTGIIDGYTSGNNFNIKVWRSGTLYEDVEINHLSGPETFTPLESYIGEITQTITAISRISSSVTSMDVYPNPATNTFNIDVNNTEPTTADISLFHLDGTMAKTIYQGNLDSGKHTFNAFADDLAPGVYLIKSRLNNDGMIIKKLVIK